jgi:thioredoxin
MLGPGDWKAIEASAKPVLVDFWAEWCGPCRAIAPAFDKLAEKYAGEFLFAKVNLDEAPELAAKYGIRSIPTLLLLKDGKVAQQIVGARSYNELAGILEAYLPAPVRVN